MTTRWNSSKPGPVRIKICGVKTVADVTSAVDAGADAIGLVFAGSSPRCIDHDTARTLAEHAAGDLAVVSLYVDPSEDDLDHHVGDWIQLHGDEDESVAAMAAARARVIKAIPFCTDAIERWLGCEHVERLIVDGPRGGSGEPFDHAALLDLRTRIGDKLVVAGGLTPDTVARAVELLHPWGVDVSSGVESTRGTKDHARIAAFCQAARTD